jgi:hypothetical protein
VHKTVPCLIFSIIGGNDDSGALKNAYAKGLEAGLFKPEGAVEYDGFIQKMLDLAYCAFHRDAIKMRGCPDDEIIYER